MKHAFLIIVHHEFEILQKLIYALDDYRNDIYVHFDSKILTIPKIEVLRAGYFIVENRVDVKWGDISQIECEYVLFEAAIKNGPYFYYHLLSGVDMPLKSQDEIHAFFEKNTGKEFIGFFQGNASEEIDRKVRRYHLFPKSFRAHNSYFYTFRKIFRALFLRLQYVFKIRRNADVNFMKGTSWISVTESFLSFVLQNKNQVMNLYYNTFCADEIFIHTLCWNSHFKNKIYDINDEAKGCKRLINWKDGVIHDWNDSDFSLLNKSNELFARKFTSTQLGVVDKILDTIIVKNCNL